MKSEQIDQLAIALSKAQGEMPAIPMNSVNPFLHNKYADLGEMIRRATPVLVKYNLAISQQTISEPNHVGVTTTLVHSSGQWIESTIMLPLGDEKGKSLAQVAGSIITYLRRYSFGAIVGLYTDEDSDGNKQEQQPKREPKADQASKTTPEITYEQACEVVGNDKKKYGDCTTPELEGKISVLERALKKPIDNDMQTRYIYKLAAAKTILEHRASEQKSE